MLPPWAQRISSLLAADPSKTISGLARACGIAQPSVSAWLSKGDKATKMISGDNLVAAANYLGVSAEYIMTGRNRGNVVSESKETRLDPEMISVVHEALRKAYAKELGRPFDIEKEPARFVRVYEFRNRFSPDLPVADFVQILRDGPWLELATSKGDASDGRSGKRKDGLPANGDDQGRMAGRVQRKKG